MDARFVHLPHLAGDEQAHLRVNAVIAAAHQGFAADLEQDPAVARGFARADDRYRCRLCDGVAQTSSPSW
jgi:hypothetical protein